ncbi:DNA-3-methyladenine glycosylase 2 [Tessaracoccus massiliensis]|uniref:DNA-3-methyladenine glycosylase 2 n=1 Tax=Tessaracoccus massiliensis TaxID=1522311 RepID=UPI00058C4BA4|nr:Ada metal-binding domain-containing protein [Tessaracoccus massiliensis]
MHTDEAACLRAIRAKDARFDGVFYTGVTSTGIYCRPSCPARTPQAGNVRFYPTAAAAQAAGFRACKRCLPGAAPGSPEWDVRGDTVARAMRLIDDGVVDREGVPGLAATLGYSPRQLQRLLADGVGAGPVALARTRRRPTPSSGGLTFVDLTLPTLPTAISRVRRLLDLDADPVAVAGHLGRDPHLGALVRKHPGCRIPRSVDGDELAVRIVLGQQVSTAAAQTHGARLVAAAGAAVETPIPGLTHLFPTTEAVAEVPDSALAFPDARRQTLRRLARALAGRELDLGVGADRAEVCGISLGGHDSWRPWRSYAAQYLWALTPHAVNTIPGRPACHPEDQ